MQSEWIIVIVINNKKKIKEIIVISIVNIISIINSIPIINWNEYKKNIIIKVVE